MAVIQLTTAEELFRLPSDFRCELIDGVVIELSPPGGLHSVIAGHFAVLIAGAEAQGIGRVLGEAGFILRRNPDRVRAPDVAFIRKERLPASGWPVAYWDIPPDLIVEVASPNDTATEIQTKISDWIEFGVPLVVQVYPDSRSIEVARSLQQRERLALGDTLDLDPAIPGFSISVAEIFE